MQNAANVNWHEVDADGVPVSGSFESNANIQAQLSANPSSLLQAGVAETNGVVRDLNNEISDRRFADTTLQSNIDGA